MEDQPIGYTACPQCQGRGKKDSGTVCAGCEGTGMVAVYSAPVERPFEQE